MPHHGTKRHHKLSPTPVKFLTALFFMASFAPCAFEHAWASSSLNGTLKDVFLMMGYHP